MKNKYDFDCINGNRIRGIFNYDLLCKKLLFMQGLTIVLSDRWMSMIFDNNTYGKKNSKNLYLNSELTRGISN